MGRFTKQNRRQKSCHISLQEINRRAAVLAVQLAVSALKARGIYCTQPSSPPLIYVPRMDIMDDPTSPRMGAIFELPGVRYDQVSVTVRHGIMRVCGRRIPRNLRELCDNTGNGNTGSTERSDPNTGGNNPPITADTTRISTENRYFVQELRYGFFKRELRLPNGIKEGDMMAILKEGLLVVTWPRYSNELDTTSHQEEPKSNLNR